MPRLTHPDYPELDAVLTSAEFAERVGVHPETVNNACREGRLPHRATNSGNLIPTACVETYQARGRGRPAKAS